MINTLNAVSADASQLQEYLSENFQEVYDYFNNEKHSVLLQNREDLDRYILFKIQTFRQLNIHNNINLSFLTLLLDISERFEFRGAFQSLYDILKNKNFDFGKRLKAAALYLVEVNTSADYLNRFDQIYTYLQVAFETEEDTEAKVLTTMINYYAQVVYNFEFKPQVAILLKEKITNKRLTEPHSFLQHPIIQAILDIPTVPHDEGFKAIHKILDSYLGIDIVRIFSKDEFLIEDKSQYSYLLTEMQPNFNAIREINNSLYLPVKSDSIFHSLQRGVKILEDESQLFAYMYSYGKMHHAKLVSAFQFLPERFFNSTIRVIDWGCGQGLAIMSYLDYLKGNNINQDLRHITLIEPSEIALKRATLHSNIFTGGNNILTINKDLDSLVDADMKNSIPTAKLHLFSNILDIDLFSMTSLLERVAKCFAGENYFVCVSPYVNDVKNSRIDSFVNYFTRFNGFEVFGNVDNRKWEWQNNWSRVVRVFKARI
jgi:hypothetical protein